MEALMGMRRINLAVAGLSLALIVSAATALAEPVHRSRGQLLHVPIYSEIPFGDKGRTLNLSATLSFRNTDRKHPLLVRKVDYYNSEGTRMRSYIVEPAEIKPLASRLFVVQESDRAGGVAAFFWVEWESATPVSAPIVEAVMISTMSATGVSFTTSARVIEETP
jgi:hypothetical protein